MLPTFVPSVVVLMEEIAPKKTSLLASKEHVLPRACSSVTMAPTSTSSITGLTARSKFIETRMLFSWSRFSPSSLEESLLSCPSLRRICLSDHQSLLTPVCLILC